MPGVYGNYPAVSMQPGDRALVVGWKYIPGFFGNVTPGGNGSTTDPDGDYPETLAANAASGPVVISAMGGRHPSTQRQLIWQVYPKGTVGLDLQVATADNAEDYVTIDTYSGSSNSGPRVITADNTATTTRSRSSSHSQAFYQLPVLSEFWILAADPPLSWLLHRCKERPCLGNTKSAPGGCINRMEQL